MGQFAIQIRGIGAHHNIDNPTDVDRLASKFVEALRGAGHSVTSAVITTGGETDLGHLRYVELGDIAEPTQSPGRVAFEAYRLARGGKNHDGSPTPTWDEVGDGVRGGWEHAAGVVRAGR